WLQAVASARQRGLRVLAARPSGAEVELTHAGLSDLLDGVDLGALGLPAPQRRALEIAILRAEPEGDPPQPHAIALGFLGVLRALSSERPVLVTIDDLQWLDAPTADTLAFAARRLEQEAVAFLVTRRPSIPTALGRVLEQRAIERIEVGPLSRGALRELLSARLGLNTTRHLLHRIADTTFGNPLFALEVGRQLVARGLPGLADELPVPAAVDDLLDARVGLLSAEARRLLLAAALGGDLRLSELARLAAPETLDEAVEAGLLVVEGERVRASHPLLAAAARKRSRAQERRALHLELARAAGDEERRARHLARAAAGADEEVAATVAAAAAGAAARGARGAAVELAEHALRLTPAASPLRSERVLLLGAQMETAGEIDRLSDLLTRELDSIPPGSPRARAWLLLAEGGHVRHVDQYRDHLERAVEEARDDPALRARALAKMSSAVIAVERIREAEQLAVDVLPVAARAGASVERTVLFALECRIALARLPRRIAGADRRPAARLARRARAGQAAARAPARPRRRARRDALLRLGAAPPLRARAPGGRLAGGRPPDRRCRARAGGRAHRLARLPALPCAPRRRARRRRRGGASGGRRDRAGLGGRDPVGLARGVAGARGRRRARPRPRP